MRFNTSGKTFRLVVLLYDRKRSAPRMRTYIALTFSLDSTRYNPDDALQRDLHCLPQIA